MNALVIVAHPDDEVIWMGGYIQRHRDFQWFAISVCYGGCRPFKLADNPSEALAKEGIWRHHGFSRGAP